MKAIVNIQNLSFTYGKDKILNDVNVNFSEAKLSVEKTEVENRLCLISSQVWIRNTTEMFSLEMKNAKR